MCGFALFTDASLNVQLSVGAGAFFLIPESFFAAYADPATALPITDFLQVKKFSATASTALETATALWALESFVKEFTEDGPAEVTLYTDSQCLAGLLQRRSRLERNGFIAKRSGLRLKNASLYQAFFKLYDALGFEVIKVSGHTRSSDRDSIESIFSFLDREVRRALRGWVRHERLALRT